MKMNRVGDFLDYLFPNPKCELNYNNLFELVISVMLSSQTLDKRVNEVTPILFNKYDTLEKLINANINDIIEIIKPLGLASTKAKIIQSIANDVLIKFNGKVPETFEELVELSGVGEKTAFDLIYKYV